MNIPVTFGTWLAAALPIAALLVLMVKFQWSAAQAAPMGLCISMITAVVVFKADFLLIAMESAKGIWSALVVLIVVWPALLLFEVVNNAKAFRVFRSGMQLFTPNELLQIMILGWVFPSFLQGITGFGVPVAVGAPLLLGIGVVPLWAVLLPLIGHTWGNTFGTLAVAWDSLVSLTGLASNPAELARTALWACAFIWLWNLTAGVAICWFYGKGEALKKGLPAVLLLSLVQGGGQLLMGQFNTTLACFVPCCGALLTVLLLGKTKRYGAAWRIEDSTVMNRDAEAVQEEACPANMSMAQAFSPYFLLTAITLLVLLIPPVKSFLGQFKIGFAFPQMSTGYGYVNPAVEMYSPLAPFTHAGIFLLISAVAGFCYFRRNGWLAEGSGREVFRRSIEKTVPSGLSVIGFIVMSRIMGGSGQTIVLAQGIAAVFGRGYALLAPIVGLLGAFMTSSNMASNILFSEFQMTTANLLHLDTAAILGGQTAGGAIGGSICPGNIVLGATTGGIPGKEGLILKKILPIALAAASALGVILLTVLVLL